jgi:hypothetical protein
MVGLVVFSESDRESAWRGRSQDVASSVSSANICPSLASNEFTNTFFLFFSKWTKCKIPGPRVVFGLFFDLTDGYLARRRSSLKSVAHVGL